MPDHIAHLQYHTFVGFGVHDSLLLVVPPVNCKLFHISLDALNGICLGALPSERWWDKDKWPPALGMGGVPFMGRTNDAGLVVPHISIPPNNGLLPLTIALGSSMSLVGASRVKIQTHNVIFQDSEQDMSCCVIPVIPLSFNLGCNDPVPLPTDVVCVAPNTVVVGLTLADLWAALIDVAIEFAIAGVFMAAGAGVKKIKNSVKKATGAAEDTATEVTRRATGEAAQETSEEAAGSLGTRSDDTFADVDLDPEVSRIPDDEFFPPDPPESIVDDGARVAPSRADEPGGAATATGDDTTSLSSSADEPSTSDPSTGDDTTSLSSSADEPSTSDPSTGDDTTSLSSSTDEPSTTDPSTGDDTTSLSSSADEPSTTGPSTGDDTTSSSFNPPPRSEPIATPTPAPTAPTLGAHPRMTLSQMASETGSVLVRGQPIPSWALWPTTLLLAYTKFKLGIGSAISSAGDDWAVDDEFTVVESAQPGDTVGTIELGLSDDGYGTVFTIVSGNEEGNFSIDAEGIIHVVGELDFETTDTYTLTVEVFDPRTEMQTIATVTIHVTDLTVAANDMERTVSESAQTGEYVGTVAASASPTGTEDLTYEIVGGNGAGHFQIDADGEITLAAPVNFETSGQHQLTIRVTHPVTRETADAAVTINVSNVIVTIDDNHWDVDQSATQIGTPSARIVDTQDTSGRLEYRIVGDAGPFSIDEMTGFITATAELTEDAYLIEVEVTDPATQESDTATITINVTHEEPTTGAGDNLVFWEQLSDWMGDSHSDTVSWFNTLQGPQDESSVQSNSADSADDEPELSDDDQALIDEGMAIINGET